MSSGGVGVGGGGDPLCIHEAPGWLLPCIFIVHQRGEEARRGDRAAFLHPSSPARLVMSFFLTLFLSHSFSLLF